MSLFPRIQSPCPYKGNLADIMDGSLCRLCKREVHDLTFMSEAERFALVKGCKTEICVSYAVSARSALAAVAMGAAAVATPAVAEVGQVPAYAKSKTQAQLEVEAIAARAAVAAGAEADDAGFIAAFGGTVLFSANVKDIVVGGLRAPDRAEWVQHDMASSLPALPVTYEDAEPTAPAKAKANPPMKPVAS